MQVYKNNTVKPVVFCLGKYQNYYLQNERRRQLTLLKLTVSTYGSEKALASSGKQPLDYFNQLKFSDVCNLWNFSVVEYACDVIAFALPQYPTFRNRKLNQDSPISQDVYYATESNIIRTGVVKRKTKASLYFIKELSSLSLQPEKSVQDSSLEALCKSKVLSLTATRDHVLVVATNPAEYPNIQYFLLDSQTLRFPRSRTTKTITVRIKTIARGKSDEETIARPVVVFLPGCTVYLVTGVGCGLAILGSSARAGLQLWTTKVEGTELLENIKGWACFEKPEFVNNAITIGRREMKDGEFEIKLLAYGLKQIKEIIITM